MGLRGKATSTGGDFEPAPEGAHNAVCTRVVDCGTQDTKFGPKRRIHLGFEIDELRADGERFMAFGNYTLSLHEKATLRHMLEAWRGQAYTEDDEIDLAALVGRPCVLTLVRSENGEYTNISAISALVKGMQPLQPAGDTVIFDCDEPDLGQLDKLGDRFQERIKDSPEFKRAMQPQPRDPATAANYGGAGMDSAEKDFRDDDLSDVPF